MNKRTILFSVYLLIFAVLFRCAGSYGATVGLTMVGPLPSDPNDWVCQDSVVDLTQAQIISWCVADSSRGEPALYHLRVPPPLADLDLKNAFDKNLEDFLRNRVYATELDWNHDPNWRMTGPYVGAIGSGEFYGGHSSAVHIY